MKNWSNWNVVIALRTNEFQEELIITGLFIQTIPNRSAAMKYSYNGHMTVYRLISLDLIGVVYFCLFSVSKSYLKV